MTKEATWSGLGLPDEKNDGLHDRLGPGSCHDFHPAMYHSLPLQDLDKVGHEESSGNHHHQAQRRTRQIGIENIERRAFRDFPLVAP